MKVSLNWIRQLNQKYHCSADPAPQGVEALVEKIGVQLGAVDEVIDLGKKYEQAVIVKVLECKKHPNADKLSVCMINTGKKQPVQVVCGAPNVKAGMLAVWLPPGATVPSTYDKEPFVLEAREIRGQMSNGMLASAKELALGDDHSGIVEVDVDASPGADFAKTYGLDDYIIDIENKMFTHRPDLFGQLGIARELAGIQGHTFRSPDWYGEDAVIKSDGRSSGLKLEVKNDVPDLVPRFCAIAIKDVKVTESPLWLKAQLSSAGIRPINNVVDLTNYYMMLTAQPLHAYDYDKVKTGTLGVRLSKKGEQLNLLGGKQLKLDEGAVVITDGQDAIGLGGIMGGAKTEVDDNTKNIILEVASFDMNQTRKTAMRYGLFTDAATRFTKNQSSRQNGAVIAKATDDILRIAGGRVASKFIDVKSRENREKSVRMTADFINSRLGLSLSSAEIKKLLVNVEFKVDTNNRHISVIAPFWRTDIEIPEDIVEEVGRLYGYDKLPVVLPQKDLTPARKNELISFKSRVRNILSGAGANEVLTYSFIHESLLKKVGQNPKNAYHIRNAISPDLQYYRLNLMPSLLEKVHPNIRAGFENFALFEIGKGHVKNELDNEKLPKEYERIALVWAAKDRGAGSPYFSARKICDYLLYELGIHGAAYSPGVSRPKLATPTYYEEARSAEIKIGDQLLGSVGEFKVDVKSALKLPYYCAGFELHIKDLMAYAAALEYQPINRFPGLEQDFNLRSSTKISYQELTGFMMNNLERLSKSHSYHFWLSPLDIFQKEDDQDHKQTTWRIVLSHPDRTLTTEESNKLLDELADTAKQEIKAERI